MDTTTYLSLRDDFLTAFHNRRLLDALRAQKGQLSLVGSWQEEQVHEQIMANYQSLLRYFRLGAKDPSQEERFAELLQRTFVLEQSLQHAFTMAHTQQYRAELWKRLTQHREQQSLAHTLRYETDNHRLFERLFCAELWTSEVSEAAEELMRHPNRNDATRATLLSAVTLSLLASFDPIQCAWLLRQTEKTLSHTLRVRVCVGLVYVAMLHVDAILLFPLLVAQWRAWTAQEAWRKDLNIVQTAMLATGHSRDVAVGRLKFMESMSEVSDKEDGETKPLTREDFARFMADRLVDGMTGVDIAFEGFEIMSRQLPYFKEAAFWFVPFSTECNELRHLKDALPPEKQQELGSMGNTDLYIMAEINHRRSQLLKLLQQKAEEEGIDIQNTALPELLQNNTINWSGSNVEGMEYIGDENYDALNEDEEDEEPMEEKLRKHKLQMAYLAYLHDTFRFFSLFVGRNESDNPYRQNLVLKDHPLFHHLFEDEDSIACLGEICFNIKDYAHALQLFQQVSPHRDVRVRLAQCLHAAKHYAEAAEYLEELLEHEDDEDLLRLLAACYDGSDRPEDALVVWLRIEQQQPEDLEVSEQLAQHFLSLQLYADASDQIHKMLYHDPQHEWAQRQKALCQLLMGSFATARSSFEHLVETHPDDNDLLLSLGHCALLEGDVPAACRLYLAFLEQEEMGFVPNDFFDVPQAQLSHVGFTPHLAVFMRDLLNCELQQ